MRWFGYQENRGFCQLFWTRFEVLGGKRRLLIQRFGLHAGAICSNISLGGTSAQDHLDICRSQ